MLTIVTVESEKYGPILRYEKNMPNIRTLCGVVKEVSSLVEGFALAPGMVKIEIETVQEK